MKLLPELLREKSLELHTRYAYIKQIAGSGFQKYATQVGYLTDHGPQHYENLETNLSLLLPDEVKQQLDAEEIFLLLCAVHFHDVGLLSEQYPDEPWTDVRKDHVNRTYDYLHDFYREWRFNQFEASVLKNICLGHSGDTLYELPEEAVIHHARIRVRFLAALLRIGDELDLDYTRVSPVILDLKKIPEKSLEHWKKHEEVGGMLINPKSWTIEIHVMPTSEASKAIIEGLVEQKLQRELGYVRPVFEKYGLYYRQVIVKYHEFGNKRSTRDQSNQSKQDVHSTDEASQQQPSKNMPSGNSAVSPVSAASAPLRRDEPSLLNRDDLLEALSSCIEAVFVRVVAFSHVPPGMLSGYDKPQAIRADELIRWAESEGDQGLYKLNDAFERAKHGKKNPS